MQHSLFYDWKHQLKPFGRGGTVNPGEEKGHLLTYLKSINESVTMVFVEQPLALPKSAN